MPASCPSPESVLSLVSGQLASPDSGLSALRHLARCPDCRSALSFVSASILANGAAARERNMAFDFLVRRVRLLLHNSPRLPDAFAASAAGERILFRSIDGATPDRAWNAELLLPHPDAPSPEFSVRLQLASGTASASGRFVLFGVSVPVRNGSASLPPDILGNATPSGKVAFVAPDGTVTPGVPVFDALADWRKA